MVDDDDPIGARVRQALNRYGEAPDVQQVSRIMREVSRRASSGAPRGGVVGLASRRRVAGAGLAAAVLVAAISFRAIRHASPIEASPSSPVAASARPVTFVVRAVNAKEVIVAGDFTNWTPLSLRQSGGVWVATIHVAAGAYRYQVRLDGGPWAADPDAPVGPDDGFGTVGSVLVVDPVAAGGGA